MSCCIKNVRPDLVRCQGMKRNESATEKEPSWQRCAETPVWLATEAAMSEDGHMSTMALCDECRRHFEEQSHIQCLFKRIPKLCYRPVAGTA